VTDEGNETAFLYLDADDVALASWILDLSQGLSAEELAQRVPALALGLTGGRASASGAGQVAIYRGVYFPNQITAGPDGALWFTESGNNAIGRVSLTGKVSFYSDPGMAGPGGITVGSDKALWFTNGDSIGRITTAGRSASTPAPASTGRTESWPGPTAPSGSPTTATARSGGSQPPSPQRSSASVQRRA